MGQKAALASKRMNPQGTFYGVTFNFLLLFPIYLFYRVNGEYWLPMAQKFLFYQSNPSTECIPIK